MADDPNGIVTTLPGSRTTARPTLYPGLEGFPQNAFLFPSLMSAHEEIEISRREAVRQARQAERRSETIRGGLDRKVNTLVGADLFPRLTRLAHAWASRRGRDRNGLRNMRGIGEALFKSWAIDRRKICDAEGHTRSAA
jgi:hypothetical protein